MANNYDDGYQSALRGETFSGSGAQEYAGYAAGKEARDRFQPTTNVDGVTFTALACAVPVCIIYPIGGAAAVGAMVLTWKIAEWSGVAGASPWVLPLMVLLALVAFFPEPPTHGFSVRPRPRFGASKPKTGKGFLRGRPNPPARPSPYRTGSLKP